MKIGLPLTNIVVALIVATGCPSDKDDNTETQANETGTETGTETETEGEAHENLFECSLTAACEQIYFHLDPEPADALACAADLIANGTPGVLSAIESLGGDIDETEKLVVLLGDGTALHQSRHRGCGGSEPCSDPPWEPVSRHSICDIADRRDVVEACSCSGEDCGRCEWHPFEGALINCREVEDWTCEDVEASTTLG